MAEIKPLVLNSGDYAEMSPTADSIRVSSLGVGVASPGAGSLSMTGTLTVSSMGAGALVTDASGVASSIPGVAGQLLTSNGPGVAPSFQAPPPASVDIGSSIPSGTAGRVLFVGAGPALAEDAAFTWDSAAKFLTVGGGTAAFELGAVRSVNGDVSVGSSNTDGAGGGARSVLRATNPGGVITEIGTTGGGFATVAPLDANDAFLRSNCGNGLKVINTSGNISFFPNALTTAMLTLTTTAATSAAGVSIIAGGGVAPATFDIGAVRSIDGDAVAGSSNTDNVGTLARSIVRALNPGNVITEIGTTGGGFATVAPLDANDAFLRSNCGNGLKVINTSGNISFFPNALTTSMLTLTATAATSPAGVSIIAGGGVAPASFDIGAVRSIDGDAVAGSSNTDNVGTLARSVVRALNPGNVITEIGTTGGGFAAAGGLAANDAFLRTNCANGLKVINTSGGMSFYLSAAVTPVLSMTNTTFGIFGATPVVQQSIAAFTNGVTSGGVNNSTTDYGIVDYATDGPAIRNNIYQLGRTLDLVVTALRNYGFGV